jgi:hypothetical protein
VFLRRIFRGAALAASSKTVICGVGVINAGEPKDDEHLFGLVEQALAVLAEADERAFRKIQTALRIVVVGYEGSTYWPELNAIAISRHTLEKQSSAWVASVLVHELCHARLRGLGFRYAETTRSRLEAVCIRSQKRFLANLPGSESLQTHLDTQLGELDRSMNQDRKMSQLESLGLPRWLSKRL